MSSNITEKPPNIDIRVEVITPQIAEEYLTHNKHNRRVRTRVVTGYATDMREGRWELNGDALRFDVDGAMVDGQHRMLAVIQSGVSVPMVVVRGVSPTAQNTMDTGINRKFSDVLKLQGEDNAITLAAAVRGLWTWNQGSRLFTANGLGVTTPQLLTFWEANTWLRDEMPLVRALSTHVKLPASISGALIMAFYEIDPDDAEYFFRRLRSDEEHRSGDPITTLRRALLASGDIRGPRNQRYLAAITCKAWNKFRAGEQCHLLKFTSGGAKPEPFPEPK